MSLGQFAKRRFPGGEGAQGTQLPGRNGFGQRTQLHGAPEPGVRTAVVGQEAHVLGAEIKEPGQLLRAGVGVLAPVAGGLLVTQEFNGHGSKGNRLQRWLMVEADWPSFRR